MSMKVSVAQQELRTVFLNGAAGQLVSGSIWLVAASLATWGTPKAAIVTLVFGGMLIFPLTQLSLRLAGRPAALAPENPLGKLAMQIAFTIPLTLPLAGAAALYRPSWFFPACLVIVGAHYLPFVFLYGMWQYAVLCAVLAGSGLALALGGIEGFAVGAWLGALILFAFGAWVFPRSQRFWRNPRRARGAGGP